MKNQIFAVLSVVLLGFVVSCVPNSTIRHGLGARAEEKDLCRLTVINETPYTFKFRVGHLWWEEQDGLLPHRSTGNRPMLLEQDEEHVLVRVFSVEGRVQEDKYYFYVPKGTKEHTITFGGLQDGVLLNRSGETIRVVPPATGSAVSKDISALRDGMVLNGNPALQSAANLLPDSVRTWGIILRPGEFARFKVQPYNPVFVVFFGKTQTERYAEIAYKINDVHKDQYFSNGEVDKWVDWLGYIEPRHAQAAVRKK